MLLTIVLIGLFTVAIFGPFLAHFSMFGQKNDQNDLKNEMKNDMKNGYHEHPGKQK